MKRQSVVPKKKRGPPATGKGTQVQVRLHDPELSALDDWRRTAEYIPGRIPTRPEAIRYALRDWLIGAGELPLDSTPKKKA